MPMADYNIIKYVYMHVYRVIIIVIFSIILIFHQPNYILYYLYSPVPSIFDRIFEMIIKAWNRLHCSRIYYILMLRLW